MDDTIGYVLTVLSLILSTGSVIALIISIFTFFMKIVRWKDGTDEKIVELQDEIKSIKGENRILTIGVLACLKGLKEQGCNGPVTEAIHQLEAYMIDNTHI